MLQLNLYSHIWRMVEATLVHRHGSPLHKECFILLSPFFGPERQDTQEGTILPFYIYSKMKKTALCFAVSCFYINLHSDLNDI